MQRYVVSLIIIVALFLAPGCATRTGELRIPEAPPAERIILGDTVEGSAPAAPPILRIASADLRAVYTHAIPESTATPGFVGKIWIQSPEPIVALQQSPDLETWATVAPIAAEGDSYLFAAIPNLDGTAPDANFFRLVR